MYPLLRSQNKNFASEEDPRNFTTASLIYCKVKNMFRHNSGTTESEAEQRVEHYTFIQSPTLPRKATLSLLPHIGLWLKKQDFEFATYHVLPATIFCTPCNSLHFQLCILGEEEMGRLLLYCLFYFFL